MAKLMMDDLLLAVDNAEGKKQRRVLFKRKRGGVMLTREQVTAIKAGRKLLRKELKERGIKGKEEFQLMASSMGLYYDRGSALVLLGGLLQGHGLLMLAALGALALGVLFLFSAMTQLKGHFTINMSDGMFREGFVLSETEDFSNPTTHLFCEPAEEVPCISISHIPADIDSYEGTHNANYFAYTFFMRNEGVSTVSYDWSMDLNSESLQLSEAVWVMIFEDGEMTFFAKENSQGTAEALPAFGDDSRGYINLPLMDVNADPESQYQVIAQNGRLTYYRVVPKRFVNDRTIAMGTKEDVAPMETHKYTVVIWLEGDDPECTDELVGGHVGMEINMKLVSEETDTTDGSSAWEGRWDDFWDSLKFWNG